MGSILAATNFISQQPKIGSSNLLSVVDFGLKICVSQKMMYVRDGIHF